MRSITELTVGYQLFQPGSYFWLAADIQSKLCKDTIYDALTIFCFQAHEVISLEVLTLLLEKASDDSVEIAVGFLKECGLKLTELSPRGVTAIFERMRMVLHEAQVDIRVQYMIEVRPQGITVIFA